jgi:acyl-CoA reductase-like NAD-dependent aldehyde dehydrogenase
MTSVDGPGDADCGCSTAAVASESVPIACSLDGGDMPARIADWQAVLALVDARLPLANGIRLVFGPAVSTSDVVRLAVAENDCCPFFGFAVTIDGRGFALEVTAPPDGQQLLADLFGSPAGAGQRLPIKEQRSLMRVYDKHYIDGVWASSSGTGTLDVVDSTTEEVIATVPAGDVDDIDRAVQAAKRAFPAWAVTPGEERAKFLRRVKDGLEARRPELADITAREVGMPIKLSDRIQIGAPIGSFANAAQLAESYQWETEGGGTTVVREPIGVVGAITPWNYPLNQIAAKVAYALAAGCTVVLKPSEVAPIGAFVLAEIFHDVGLPAGVFNLVSGVGSVVGEALAAHPDVDMISFTGSTRAGRRVSELAAHSVKRVALELGGKSPNVILDDADLNEAVTDGVGKAYLNSGQTCSALTRMLVPRERLAEAEEIAARTAARFTVGNPFEEGIKLGPLVSAVQRDRVRSYIDKGIAEGAKLVTGGAEPPEGLSTGFFVQPTIFSEVRNDMTIAQEEIFGPVLSILPYDTEEEAIEIANDSVYGLSGAVWSGDPARANRVARRMRTGRVEINGKSFGRNAPFGGYKQSGVGREYGEFGLEEFLEIKALPTV